ADTNTTDSRNPAVAALHIGNTPHARAPRTCWLGCKEPSTAARFPPPCEARLFRKKSQLGRQTSLFRGTCELFARGKDPGMRSPFPCGNVRSQPERSTPKPRHGRAVVPAIHEHHPRRRAPCGFNPCFLEDPSIMPSRAA